MSPSRPTVDLGTGRRSLGQVLDFAWARGPFTASDAMQATALTRSTTIGAIDTLVEIGVLEELPDARAAGEYRAGRPARRFALAPAFGTVVGMDAGDEHLSITVADLAGTTLAHTRTGLRPAQSPAGRRRTIRDQLADTYDSSGATRAALLALCVGVAAPVDRAGQSPPHPLGFWERTNPGLIELLADRAPLVEVRNDALLAASAEGMIGDAVGLRDYIALLAGARLGAGVVVDGHFLYGKHGGVGETFLFDDASEAYASRGLATALETHARDLVATGSVRGPLAALPAEDLTAARVLALAEEGDPGALAVVERTGAGLARVIGVLGNMFDPERIIVCGGIAESIEPVLAAARRRLGPSILHLPAPELIASRLGEDIVVRGAVVHALDGARRISVPRLAEQRLRGAGS
ncbi:ROK family protein [Raineyella sp.]|uniref:ROK family transcriptional regulator n=1 Tax=Raineyella sp. TaxID=1911550 RepID=UPI002B2062CC|nr:ROK family protein [Raineyella sp.]MEA5153703.1 ROK family protein [Raineyella sp.]